jgi:chromosome segregation ATPase
MEITLEAIISFIGLFLSGGAGAFFTWKWQKRKAKASAEKEEAEAKNAAMDAAKNMQEAYEKMFENVNKYLDDATIKVDGMRKERDYYQHRMEETQEKFDKFNRTVMDWKQSTDDTIDDLKRKVARNGRQIEMMRPFMCGDLKCPSRQRVTTLDAEALERTIHINEEQKDIEPYNGD